MTVRMFPRLILPAIVHSYPVSTLPQSSIQVQGGISLDYYVPTVTRTMNLQLFPVAIGLSTVVSTEVT